MARADTQKPPTKMADIFAEEQAKVLSRAMGTVRKMLRDRGYDVPTAEFTTWQELKEMFDNGKKKDSLTFVAEMRSSGGEPGATKERIVIIFVEEAKIQSKEARKIISRMEKLQVSRAILIVDEPLSGSAKTALTSLPEFRIEPFLTTELVINITEHELVPVHVVLTDEEKKLVLKRYNLNESQLPRMFTHDAISRYYGLSRGHVVKIIRSSETAGRYVTYRIVVDA